MKALEPIHTTHLFQPLSHELIGLLKTLTPADWAKMTACAPWTVKDVAAHLLGGNLGRIGKPSPQPASSPKPTLGYDDLLDLINRENALWIQAAKRISPPILIELLALTDQHLYKHFNDLDPYALAPISVAWASDALPPNWFDIAREYTEKWLHQQHIREAVGWPILASREWLAPVIDTFIRGLPRTYRNIADGDDKMIMVEITGPAGGVWALLHTENKWQLFTGGIQKPSAHIIMSDEVAWRLFSKGMSIEAALPLVSLQGDLTLANHTLKLVSIMA